MDHMHRHRPRLRVQAGSRREVHQIIACGSRLHRHARHVVMMGAGILSRGESANYNCAEEYFKHVCSYISFVKATRKEPDQIFRTRRRGGAISGGSPETGAGCCVGFSTLTVNATGTGISALSNVTWAVPAAPGSAKCGCGQGAESGA